MTTAEPVPPLVIETILATQLETGIVLPRRDPGSASRAKFKTVHKVDITKSAKAPKVTVTYTDGTTSTWPAATMVVALADSLPASYWRVKYAALTGRIDGLVKSWRRTATNMGKPNPDGNESPAIRDGRARQARICAGELEATAKAVTR